jgi:hypothetical protein
MTDITQQQDTKGTVKPNSPTHAAYHVREVKNGKDIWTRIGSAWAHKDGKGFNIQIDTVPLDGSVTLRVPEQKDRK